MTQQQQDTQGEAHDALGTAVSSYGRRVLSDPHMLGNLVTDLLPDLPRERSLLVTGAEAGIAAEMTQHVEEQHIDPDTAVQLAARSLSERRSIDPAASMWVASEYAQALGYQVRPFALPSWPGEPEVTPAATPTITALSGPPMGAPPPPATPVPPQGPPPQSWPPPQGPPQSWPPQGPPPQGPPLQGPPLQGPPLQGPPPQGPPPQSWPPLQGPPPQAWPSAQPRSGGPPPTANRSKRGPVIAAIAVAGAVVLYLIIAVVAQTFPFTKSPPVAVTPPATPSITATTATPSITATTATPTLTPTTPGPTLARGVTPLRQLLPSGVPDPTTQCSTVAKPQWSNPGLVTALSCYDTKLPNGSVNGYQMDTRAHFETAWRNFNSWANFDSSRAQSSCPPSSSSADGITSWNSKSYPTMAGQVLECYTGTGSAPVYVWTLPKENTFFIATGADGSSLKALNDWWENG